MTWERGWPECAAVVQRTPGEVSVKGITSARFIEGMSPQEHMDRMKINRDRFSQVLDNVVLDSEDRDYFLGLPSSLRVAVFTEDWCGDHVSTTPVIYRVAEETGKLDVRVFIRSQDGSLANSFLPESRWGTVPVFVCFQGEEMREVARFVETAQELVPTLDGMDDAIRGMHPDVSDIRADVNQMSQSTRDLLRQERGMFRVRNAGDWGRVISRSFRETVAAGLARGPDEGPAEWGTRWPPP